MLDEKYGVTPTGFSRKRLDEIIEEIHNDLSEGFGFNTRANPKSFLSVLVTDFADKIAELWEVGEQNYNSMVPSSAEGISLDRVGQLGGSLRKVATSSFYTILCTGDNGTVIPIGTRIRTDTNPAVEFMNIEEGNISLNACVEAKISTVGSYGEYDRFSLSVDGHKFETSILSGENPISKLESVIRNDTSEEGKEISKFLVDNGNGEFLHFVFEESTPHLILVSSNLNAVSVTSLVQFGTVDFGDFSFPKNSITSIVSGVTGLKSVTNLGDYIKGNSQESDSDFRKSYAKKIFIRSRTMIESIKSAILANCNGVESVEGFENDTNVWDTNGCDRAPHSVEMVVVGGNPQEIAEQIFATKAAGINTSHCCGLVVDESDDEDSKPYAVEVDVLDDYGKPTVVRFSRPKPVYFEFYVSISAASNEAPAFNTFELIQNVIYNSVNALNPGDDLNPQKFLAELYKTVPGVLDYEFGVSEQGMQVDDVSKLPKSIKGIGYNRVARCEFKSDIHIEYA